MHYPDFDTYTVGHSVRVALLAVLVGHNMKLDDELLLELCMAGLLHDVGKSQIPDEILFKPGRLDEDERTLMETHAQIGAEILMGHHQASPLAIAGAWGHHLRHDGGGYPDAPEWAARHFLTTLLQVCDVFEALTVIEKREILKTLSREIGAILDDDVPEDERRVVVENLGHDQSFARGNRHAGGQGLWIYEASMNDPELETYYMRQFHPKNL